jgi:hypothetical protein
MALLFALMGVGVLTNLTSADSDHPVTSDVVVPSEARQVANAYLEQHWKSDVKASPSFYGLVGVDVSDATLAPPFHEYILREAAVRRFALSSDDDPRPYWTLERYAFPIVVKGGVVGSILIQRNQNEEGDKFEANAGDYFFFAVTFNGNQVDKLLMDLRAANPGADIGWVEFVGSNVAPRIVIQKSGNDILSAPQGEQPVPIAEDARKLKERLHAEGLLQQRPNEGK